MMTMFETATKLLQCIVIQLKSPCSEKRLFRGDLHTCQLHCTWRGRSFGIIDTLEKVLANAQLPILSHYDLLSTHVDPTSHDYLFREVLPPIFASSYNLSLAVRQYQYAKDKLPLAKGRITGCTFGTNLAYADHHSRTNNSTTPIN